MDKVFVENMPKLGFGLMRLPKLEDGVHIDIEYTSRMVDLFLEAGMKYFDTAYVYDGGLSEEAARAALVERHPRDSFYLATKLNVTAQGCVDEATAKKQLEISLQRTGAGYFDFYLLHALSADRLAANEKYHLWEFVKEMKEKGRIRHYGFSFHDKPEILDQILTEHPDVEFVQLQINYADWESFNVQSRACLEVARKHGKPVVVMEPVKGGTLAAPPEKIAQLLREANSSASPASWAIRFAASQEGILTVLSGMSNLEQMEDNLSYMKTFQPLNEEENAVLKEAMKVLTQIRQIPCTSCHYCTPGCPMEIPIPEIFSSLNLDLIYGQRENAVRQYSWHTGNKSKASACIQCGQCESVCPQHIEIISWLEECARTLEK